MPEKTNEDTIHELRFLLGLATFIIETLGNTADVDLEVSEFKVSFGDKKLPPGISTLGKVVSLMKERSEGVIMKERPDDYTVTEVDPK